MDSNEMLVPTVLVSKAKILIHMAVRKALFFKTVIFARTMIFCAYPNAIRYPR